MAALEQLEDAYAALRHDPRFWAELRELLARLRRPPDPALPRRPPRRRDAGERAAARWRRPTAVACRTALRLYLKREDLAHTGAHKINNALGQALLTRRLGKTRVIAETGAGQHGVATATACALLGLPCVVYMGAEDIERQQPNVLRMRALGAEVRPVTSRHARRSRTRSTRRCATGSRTSRRPTTSSARRWARIPYPTIVRDLQRRIGDEAAAQLVEVEGRLPDLALACVGGGSNAIGLLDRFIGEPSVRLAVAEAAGDGIATGRHAAALAGGTPGILHGARSMMLQDARRPGRRGALGVGRARLPGRRAADRGARRGGPARGRGGDRRRGVRGDARLSPGPRASCPRSRPPTRSRRCRGSWPAPRARRADWPDEAVVLSGCPAAATRTSRRSGAGSRRRRVVIAARRRAAAPTRRAGTNETAGARRIAAAFARRARGRPRRAHPVRRRRLPGRRDELRGSRSPRSTPAPTCSRSACRTPTRSPTAPRSSGLAASRSPPARRSTASRR